MSSPEKPRVPILFEYVRQFVTLLSGSVTAKQSGSKSSRPQYS